MIGRSQDQQRRFIVNLTGTEVADIIWMLEEGQLNLKLAGDTIQDRVAAAVQKLTEALNEQGEVWP